MTDYWNHNAAYHPWVLRHAARHGAARVLDIGCGEGLLVQRLAADGHHVVGIEPDPHAVERARVRLHSAPRASVVRSDLASFDAPSRSFDVVTMVATLHHMDARAGLGRAADLLRPGGSLLVAGLVANRSIADWAFSALTFPVACLGSVLHHESRDIGVPTAPAHESLSGIRAAAAEILPGARIRRGLYYRYLLSWTAPAGA